MPTLPKSKKSLRKRPTNGHPLRRIQHPYVWRKEGLCGGAPVIKNTRIRVSLIAELERSGSTVDEIIASYPHLNHAQVFDALSYYYENRAAIEKELAREEAAFQKLMRSANAKSTFVS